MSEQGDPYRDARDGDSFGEGDDLWPAETDFAEATGREPIVGGWQEAVDLHWLHVLLQRLGRDDSAQRQRLVARVMDQIDRELAPRASELSASAARLDHRDRRRWWVASLSAVAATLFVGLAIYWLVATGPSAQAAVQTAVEMAHQRRDRQYRVWSIMRSQSGSRMQCEGMLYMRGSERFALRHPGLLGDVWLGSNGQYEWFVPVEGEPMVSDDPNFNLRWVQIGRVGLPDLRLTELLARFADQYALELVSGERLSSDSGRPYRHVRGVRRDPRGEGPEIADLWIDPATGVAHRLVLDWKHPADRVGLLHATIELMDEDPMADDWYEPTSHHPAPFIFSKPARNLPDDAS